MNIRSYHRSDYEWDLCEFQNTHRNVRYDYVVIPIRARIDGFESTNAYKKKIQKWMEKISLKKSIETTVLDNIEQMHTNKNKIAARYPIFTELLAITEEVQKNGETWVKYCTERNRVFALDLTLRRKVWKDSSYKIKHGEEKTLYLRKMLEYVDQGIYTKEEAEEGSKQNYYDYEAPPLPQSKIDPNLFEQCTKYEIKVDLTKKRAKYVYQKVKFVPAERVK